MPYDNIISRSDAAATIPESVSQVMLTNLQTTSAALSLFQRVPMASNQTRMPVLSALPTAYFVNGDTGLKQTTEVAWSNKYLNAEEIAAIVPIPEAVLDDSSYDVWGSVRPLVEQAMGRTLDAAVFFGTNKPSSWPDAIVTTAKATGIDNELTIPTAAAADGGIAEDINDLMAMVEADGFDVNGFVAPRTFRALLRRARDTTGQKLLDVTNETVEGVRVVYAMDGLWPSASGSARLFLGDFTKGIIAVRQDFTYKVLDQAVIQDNTGAIVYNLAQQDMVALRVVFRCAFQVANPITYSQTTEASRYPFAVGLNA